MENKIALYQEMDALVKRDNVQIPETIKTNLSRFITLRPYQEKALQHFLLYEKDEQSRAYPAHLLFHMATGSGKTVIMAALILYLYEQGYRNFLFFVNSSNIIRKTKENFLNEASSKYLFADSITIGGEKIKIREVSNFDDAVGDEINIHFTTIQGLHSNLKDPRENAVTYEDFEDKKLVLISDEAHHINTLTKQGKLIAAEEENMNSWENTVQKVFKSNKDNFLLEFTATMDLENENIKEKYEDKTIYSYTLKKFRRDGYSKDIELRQSFVEPLERMFQAVLFSQYRRKIAEKHGLAIKPVVLMKSRLIKDSQVNTQNFMEFINGLTGKYIKQKRNSYRSDPSLAKIYRYFFEELQIDYDNFALELREDFSSDKIINVNEEKEMKAYQIQVNSLEDAENEIRVVFAVDKLNEGWDVLNLFDIARLYDTRDGRHNEIGKTTMQEAQLIGRGARYCPFTDANKKDEPKEKRKYDKETDNPLRCLEEMHYHCSSNSRYISEIKTALQRTGMMDEPQKELLKVKDSFKETKFYKEGWIYTNSQVKNKNKDKSFLTDYGMNTSIEYPETFSAAIVQESGLEDKRKSSGTTKIVSKEVSFNEIVLRRVADGMEFFTFNNIKSFLPCLKSMADLFKEIEKFYVSVRGDRSRIENLTKREQKNIWHYVLSEIGKHIKENSFEFIGTKEFKPKRVQEVIVDKEVYINDKNKLAELDRENIFKQEWYIYEKNSLNSLEKKLVRYIGDKVDEIKKKYCAFYLVRNEKLVKLYDFETGRGFEPDFLFFAIRDNTEKDNTAGGSLVYELFIEPKGGHIEAGDRWKENFLKKIEQDYRVENLFENTTCKVIGLPFYTKNKPDFQLKFEETLFDKLP